MFKLLLVLTLIITMTGCCSSDDSQAEVENTQVETEKEEMSRADKLREKARVSEASSLLGYDGKALHKDLQTIIDQSEKQQDMFDNLDDF